MLVEFLLKGLVYIDFMIFKKTILSFFVGIFIFAYLIDVSKVVVAYAIYYYEYNNAREQCYNEKPDMFQSGKLYLNALIKRVKDICPDSKPKPPVVESSNLVLYINKLFFQNKRDYYLKEKNRFVYTFSYDYLNFNDFFHPPKTEA